MKHFRTLTAAMALIAVLAACSDKDETCPTNERVSLSIHAGIVSQGTDAKWQANDAIGIIMLNAETTTVTGEKTNYRYKTLDEKGFFEPSDPENTAYFPTEDMQVDVLAYYPHTTAVTPSNLSVPVDVSDQTNLSAIDLMTATKITGLTSGKPNVALIFEHRLCKLVLKVVTDDTTQDVNLAGAKAVLTGTAINGAWNLTAEALTATGDSKDLELPMSADGTTATAIVMPTAAGEGKSITLTTAEGKSYIAEIDAGLALTAGTVNTYTMTLHNNQAAITASISPWTEGTTVSLNTLNIEVPADATAAGLTTFEMWRNQAQQTDSRTYTFDAAANAWTAMPHPYYIEEIASTDQFYALHTPDDADKDAITGLKDLLAAGPEVLTAASGNTANSLSLSFRHLMAQFAVTLTRGDGFPAGISPEGATLVLPEMTAAYTLDGINLTADPAQKKTYPALTVGNGTTPTLLLVPQTLATGTVFTVTLGNGQTYQATLPDALTLQPGTKNVLNLTLIPTALAIGSIDVLPWGTVTQDGGDMKSDEIAIANTSLSGISEAGMLYLAATVAGKVAPNGSGTYPVQYQGGTAGIDTKDGKYSPILWDRLDKYATGSTDKLQAYIYTAFFSPSATPPANQESDYLAGQSAATPWGTAPDFSTADNPAGSGNGTKLHHLMARLEVNVSFGSEFSAAEKDGARMTTVRNRKVEKIKDDYTGVELATVGTGTPGEIATATVVLGKHAESNGSYTFAATLAPQTLDMGAGKFLALTLNEGTAQENRYSMSDTGGLTLEAGVRYVYTVTVSKSGLAVGKLEIEPWNERTGSGSFDWE